MKLPRDLSGDELCRALQRLGFEFVRQTGSHRMFKKDDLRPCADALGAEAEDAAIDP